jgi:hypothetical protein
MMNLDPFSPAQIMGYLALILGVTAIAQKDDRRLKGMIAVQAAAYCVHFFMLGNMGGAGSTGITCFRSIAALFTRNVWVAHFFFVLYLIAGYHLAVGYAGWLPILANIVGTYAFFLLRGVSMRALILTANGMMLTTSILSGSIGGMILESIIIVTNVTTITRLVKDQQRALGLSPPPND